MYIRNEDYIEQIKSRNFIECVDNLDETVENSVLLIDDTDNSKPFITIFIPTFGRIDTLERAIRSAVFQTDSTNLEIIVIDNNSKHIQHSEIYRMIKEIKDKRIRYYCNKKNIGPMGNWNCGYQLARGKWVCMLHDDDILNQHWYAEMNRIIADIGSNVDMVCCKYKTLNNDREIEAFLSSSSRFRKTTLIRNKDILKRFCAPLLGSLIKKEFFLRLGGFNNTTKFEDYIFVANAVYHGKVLLLKNPLYGYVISENNDSNNINLWDDIIIGNYYFRKSYEKTLDTNKYDFNIKRIMVSAILSHNLPFFSAGAFTNIPVERNEILKQCNMPIYKYYLYSMVILPVLLIKQGKVIIKIKIKK